MLAGECPFYAQSEERVFYKIKTGKFKCKSYFSDDAVNLLRRLLDPDDATRLGRNGIQEIKEHRFFATVNWSDIYQKRTRVPKPVERENIGPRGQGLYEE
jgi:hypothetical protein